MHRHGLGILGSVDSGLGGLHDAGALQSGDLHHLAAQLPGEQFHKIFVKHSVKDVVFGHAHRSYGTVTIDGVTYHSRPLGYRREWDLTIDFVSNHPELNPTGTWNLSKRYNLVKKRPEFLDYEKKELANEFLSSMTLFDL